MNPSSHIRLSLDGLNSYIVVLDGAVEFTVPFEYTSTIARKKSLDFDAAGDKQPEFAKLEGSAFDDWDKNGNDYQKLYASQRLSGGAGLYGTSDLNYYGSFSNISGCGSGSFWRPYFASAAWSPYDNGMWAYYGSNVGYSWVSPYPWGWLPFHSGNWVNCGAAGWGWQPGGSFAGLQNVAAIAPVGPGGGRSLGTVPAPPRGGGGPTMVPVNTRPLSVSSVSAPGTFTFRKDSAGLGVPRDFGELKSASSDVARHGMANTEVERSAIGPSGGFAHRGDPNRNMANGNPNGPRGASNHDYTPGSRAVGTFTRTDMRANGADGMEGWSSMNHPNNGMNNGANNGAGQGPSPPSRLSAPRACNVPKVEAPPAPRSDATQHGRSPHQRDGAIWRRWCSPRKRRRQPQVAYAIGSVKSEPKSSSADDTLTAIQSLRSLHASFASRLIAVCQSSPCVHYTGSGSATPRPKARHRDTAGSSSASKP